MKSFLLKLSKGFNTQKEAQPMELLSKTEMAEDVGHTDNSDLDGQKINTIDSSLLPEQVVDDARIEKPDDFK